MAAGNYYWSTEDPTDDDAFNECIVMGSGKSFVNYLCVWSNKNNELASHIVIFNGQK